MKIRISIIVLLISNYFFAQEYHDTQGKLEISSSGQATYTLPIALPPSISSVGPTINITYASGQNSGIAGQGWNISGISYISRIATRLDIDGFKDGVDFDDNDKLALEGQRLLLKSGNYWEDGSIYETEVQSNTKIELKGSGNAIYFIVTSPDGSRSWYGNFGGMHAVDLSAYYIVRYEDAEGNFILYNYSQPLNKSLCIDTIQFSANTISNTNPLNAIKFSYVTAARSEKGYFKGVQIEKAELLNNIKVFTSGNLFKEYRIGHETDPQLGYQRVTQIREFNSAGEGANPVVFEYNTNPDDVNETTALYTDSYSVNSGAQLTGDFDGDGRMDIVENNILRYKLFAGITYSTPLPFSTTQRQKFTATTLTNNKLNQKQSIVFADETLTNIAFKIHKLNNTNGVNLEYVKNIPFDNSYGYHNGCPADSLQPQPIVAPKLKQSTEYLEGDFNGDGLSEVLIFSHFEQDFYGLEAPSTPTNKPYDPHPCLNQHILIPTYNEVRLVDLNPNVSNLENTAGNCSIINPNIFLYGTKKFVMDFNSDGKADILVLNDSHYKVVSFKQLSAAPWVELEILGEGIFDSYTADKPMLFGDYNGDGKPDIMIPVADGNCNPTAPTTYTDANGVSHTIPGTVCPNGNVWNIYYSNPNPSGGIYFDKQSYVITDYVKRTGDDFHNYYAVDVNKDGKTDLVESLVGVYLVGGFWDPTNSSSRWSISTFINNIGNNATGASSFIYNYHSPDNHVSDDNSYPIPLVADIKYRGLSSDMLIFRDHGGGSFPRTITYIDFTRNLSTENLIKKVTQSSGAIVDEITYAPMQSSTANNGYGLSSDFYSSSNALEYPFVELKQIPNNKLVQQLKNTTSGNVKYQDFKYNGYALQLNGIGSIGFVKTARSAWYTAPADKKIWSVSETDPLLRGATLRTYTTQPSTDDFAFPTDLSTGLMSKTENNFPAPNLSVFPYTLLLHSQVATDYITGIVKETVYNSYTPGYNLPKSVTTNNYLGTTLQGSTLKETTYDNQDCATCVGSNYYIGKPLTITTTNTAYNDIKKSLQTYQYSNGNITEIDKNVYLPDGVTLDPVTMVEKMNYYPNGLLKDKEVSATGTTVGVNDVTPRKIAYEYDTSNRFVNKVTDAEGLISTNDSFDPLYGTVLHTTNPFTQATTSVYDTWGKRTSVTDNALGITTHYTYTRVGDVYRTTITKTLENGLSDGSCSFIEQDVLAREVRRGSKNLNGVWTYINTEYDAFGRKYRTSEPYLEGANPTQWTVYAYDDYSRPVRVTSFTGKVVTTNYNGLTVTVQDTVMNKTKTIDANEQVVTTIDDPGGTVNYKYDANYNLLESDYDGLKTTMEYDNWGRKTLLEDRSSSTHNTYSYNAYGELLTEGTPKGITTITYDGVSGRIATKLIAGLTPADGTNILSTYSYNHDTKLLDQITVVNPNDGGSVLTYSYDPQRRLNRTDETQSLLPSGTAVFTKQLTFDAFSRVDVETSTAAAFGKTSTKAIKHSYSSNNGAENQLKDNETLSNLWLAQSVDARGNILTASLGNGIAINNRFDEFGYASQFQHQLGNTNVMTLNTSFDKILGNLNARYNSMFDTTENFTYDQLDRLTAWDANSETLLALPFNYPSKDGFIFTNTPGNNTNFGSVTNDAGTLKVFLKNGFASRTLPEIDATSCNKLRIKATISNKTDMIGTPVIVQAVMVETDRTDSSSTNEVLLGTVENGIFDVEYSATNSSITNPLLSLKFVIQDNTNNNGLLPVTGGAVTPYTTFNVDDLIIQNVVTSTQDYDDRGRITNNKVGYYSYNPDKPYQNTVIDPIPNAPLSTHFSQSLNITYNAFKAPIEISYYELSMAVSFGYNGNEQRSVMYFGSKDTDKFIRPYRRYYSADGSMEITATFAPGNISTPVKTEFLTYIGGSAYTAPVVVKSDGTNSNYFYLHRDYQSSILAITNDHGEVVEKRMFDPWGAVTVVQDGAGNNLAHLTFFDRGYTGHEHLQSVGLINMNARLYNPTLHRFLEADNFVQDPYNTQNYNRYGYCVNNPLKYTDVTGNVFNIATVASCIPVVGSIFSSLLMHQNIDWGRVAVDAVVMAVSIAVTAGIGDICKATITNFYQRAVVSAVAHGVFQGGMTAASGGKFWAGFAAGAVSSIAASFWQGGDSFRHFENTDVTLPTFAHAGIGAGTGAVGTIAFGTIMGGAASALAGGNFWQGAVTGMIVSTFNHYLHDGSNDEDGPGDPPGKYKKWFSDRIKDAKLLKGLYANYQIGENEDFHFNASDIDLGNSTQRSLGLTGKNFGGINLFKSGRIGQALAFGRIAVTRVSSTLFKILDNTFDFDYQANASLSRNVGTFIGGAIFGNFFETKIYLPNIFFLQPNKFIGGAFQVIFDGYISIPK